MVKYSFFFFFFFFFMLRRARDNPIEDMLQAIILVLIRLSLWKGFARRLSLDLAAGTREKRLGCC